MRTCSKCGAQFSDDELICPKCGQEVQLVPDYVTIESHIQKDQLKREEELRAREEEQEKEEVIERRIRQRRTHIIIGISAIVAILVISISLVLYFNKKGNDSSFEYNYSAAEASYEDGDLDGAYTSITKALALDGSNHDARLLYARILVGRNDRKEAAVVLTDLIKDFPEDEEAYDLLLQIYKSLEDYDSLSEVLKNCPLESILTKYAAYIAKAPAFSVEAGTYDRELQVFITSETAGTIYYTTNGRQPTTKSEQYTTPVLIKEGTTTLKAIVVNDKGIASDVTEAQYVVSMGGPPAPVIDPASGSYKIDDTPISTSGLTAEQIKAQEDLQHPKITVTVPDGYKCLYSFDESPTENSQEYTQPIEMIEGEHIFYAVLVENGKMGEVASATYIVTKTSKTETESETNSSDAYNSYETYTPDDYYYNESDYSETETTPDTPATPDPGTAPETPSETTTPSDSGASDSGSTGSGTSTSGGDSSSGGSADSGSSDSSQTNP